MVLGAQHPVAGSTVRLYVAGAGGKAASSKPLLPQGSVTTSDGRFSLSGTYTCPSPDAEVYVVATGGSPYLSPQASNLSLALMAALGPCNRFDATSFATINEVTTVGSIWPVASFATSSAQIRSGNLHEHDFDAAAATIDKLISVTGGTAPGPGLAGDISPTVKLYTLAKVLASCVDSSGGSAGDETPCGHLFSSVTSDGATAPTDTIGAALAIAKNPLHNVDSIFALSLFGEDSDLALPAAPIDWTLQIVPASPTILSSSGDLQSTRTVSLSESSAGTQLYYTTDGSSPSAASHLYSEPIALSSSQTFSAIAVRDGVSSSVASRTFQVADRLSAAVSPGSTLLGPSQIQAFSAALGGNSVVRWSLLPALGSISSGGVYKAPNTINVSQVVTVTASSVNEPTKTATATITLTPVTSTTATYYVDNILGSDSNNGSSPSTAFATIAKINSLPLAPGQTVAFKSGDQWHEQLLVTRSGAAGYPITYTSYGTGAQPIISAADIAAGWTQGGGLASSDRCSTGQFCSGFEAGGATLSEWSSVSNNGDTTVTQSATVSNHGTYSMKLASTGGVDTRAWVTENLAAVTSGSNLGIRFALQIPAGGLKPNAILKAVQFHTASSDDAGTVYLITDASGNINKISLYDGADSIHAVGDTLITPITPGAWHYLEFDTVASSSVGSGAAFVDGALVATSNAINTANMISINRVDLGNMNYGGAIPAHGALYFDDVKIVTSGAPIGNFSGTPTSVWSHPQTTDPRLINIAGRSGIPVGSAGAILFRNQFYWSGSMLYVYSIGDPTTSVEIPTRSYALASPSGASYVTVSGLELRGAQQSDLFCTNVCHDWTVANNTINASYSTAIFFEVTGHSSVAGITIRKNKVKGGGAGGIQVNNGLGQVIITGNEVWDFAKMYNPAYGTQNVYADGIEMYSEDGLQGFGTVTDNYIHDGGVGINQNYGGGIHADTVAGMDIEHNTIKNVNGSGIQLEKGSGSIARYNLIVNSGTHQYNAGLQIRAGEGTSVSQQIAENNTIYGGWWACNLGITQDGPFVTATYITFQKNICDGAVSGTQFYAGDAGWNGIGNTFFANAFGVEANSFLVVGGTSYSTYASAPVAVAGTAVQGNPQFVDPSSGNYNLLANSPYLGIGAFQ